MNAFTNKRGTKFMLKKLFLSGLTVVSVLAVMAVGVNAIANSDGYNGIEPTTVITRTGTGQRSINVIPGLSRDDMIAIMGPVYEYSNGGFRGTLPLVSFEIRMSRAYAGYRGMVSCFITPGTSGSNCR